MSFVIVLDFIIYIAVHSGERHTPTMWVAVSPEQLLTTCYSTLCLIQKTETLTFILL